MVADNVVALQNIMDIWNTVRRQDSMKINTACGKTEFVHVSRIPEQLKNNLGEQQINRWTNINSWELI